MWRCAHVQHSESGGAICWWQQAERHGLYIFVNKLWKSIENWSQALLWSPLPNCTFQNASLTEFPTCDNLHGSWWVKAQEAMTNCNDSCQLAEESWSFIARLTSVYAFQPFTRRQCLPVFWQEWVLLFLRRPVLAWSRPTMTNRIQKLKIIIYEIITCLVFGRHGWACIIVWVCNVQLIFWLKDWAKLAENPEKSEAFHQVGTWTT